MKIDKLTERMLRVPRNKQGDPAFEKLYLDPKQDAVLLVFTEEEVVELVNRALYQLEYQQKAHSKYRAEREAVEKPIKSVFKQLYPHVSFAKATDDQLLACVVELKNRRG